MTNAVRTRRNKVLGIREKNTIKNAASILQDLTERYITTNTELLEAYDIADNLRNPQAMKEEIEKLENTLAKMETEITTTVADVYQAIIGLNAQNVIRQLRHRAYAIANKRRESPNCRKPMPKKIQQTKAA